MSKKEIAPDDGKVEKIGKYPPPRDTTQARQFLGLASYYRRFIPDFAKVALPLYALTKKSVEFVWSPECQDAFTQ